MDWKSVGAARRHSLESMRVDLVLMNASPLGANITFQARPDNWERWRR